MLKQLLSISVEPDVTETLAKDNAVYTYLAPLVEWGRGIIGDRKLGEFLAEPARHAIEELLRQPKLLPPALVHEVASQDAMEQLLSTVLFDAITQFADKLFMFIANLTPIVVRKPFLALKSDFDRRVEPEIRRFLAVASREGLRHGAQFLLAHQDDPAFVDFRIRMFRWLLDQPLKEVEHHQQALLAVADAIVRDPAVQRTVHEALRPHAGDSLATFLARLKTSASP